MHSARICMRIVLFFLLLRFLWWSLGLTFSSSYSSGHLEMGLLAKWEALGSSGLYWGLAFSVPLYLVLFPRNLGS